MKKTIKTNYAFLFIGALFFSMAANASAVEYKLLSEEPPSKGSPADVYISFLKAGTTGDVEQMRELAHGNQLRFLSKEEIRENILKRAKNVDWDRPIKWAQKVEGEKGKVAVNYYQKDSGKLFRAQVILSKVDKEWKYGN